MAKSGSFSAALAGLPGWPLMLDEQAAAAYCSLFNRHGNPDVATFHKAVALGQIPQPQLLAGRTLWSRVEIDASRDRTGAVTAADPDHDPIAAAIARAA